MYMIQIVGNVITAIGIVKLLQAVYNNIAYKIV